MRIDLAPRLAALILLSLYAAGPVAGQDLPKRASTDELFRVTMSDGTAYEGGTVACPGDNFVGANPLTIHTETSTSSETDVAYRVQFEYSNTTLSATATSSNGPFSMSETGGTTTLLLETFFNSSAPLIFDIVTTAIAPGSARTYIRTMLGSSTTKDEECLFEITQRLYTLNVESVASGAEIQYVIDGDHGADTTPFSREVPENAQVSLAAPDMFDGQPFTEWKGRVASMQPLIEFVMVGHTTETAYFGLPPTADVGIRLVAVEGGAIAKAGGGAVILDNGEVIIPPDTEAAIKFLLENFGPDAAVAFISGFLGPPLAELLSVAIDGELCGGSGGSFTCPPTDLPAGSHREIIATVATGSDEGTTSGGLSASLEAPVEDPNLSNNAFGVGLGVFRRGSVFGQKFYDTNRNGTREPDEVGINGILIELLDATGALIADVITAPRDIDGSGTIDPSSEYGRYAFTGLAPGTYTVVEVDLGDVWESTTATAVQFTITAEEDIEVDFGNYAESIDWGDLPDSFATLASSNGAGHVLRPDMGLGTVLADSEDDGKPTPGADGDDLDGVPDDEDGLTQLRIDHDGMVTITVLVDPSDSGTPDLFSGWIDFNDDGIFDPVDERIAFRSVSGPPASQIISFPLNEGHVIRYARFRLIAGAVAFPDGIADGGEVEDYLLLTEDFGDAPDTSDPLRPDIPFGYPTRRLEDGARHVTTGTYYFGTAQDIVATVRLGDANDGDFDGHPSLEADGDDRDRMYDEEGILFDGGFIAMRVQPDFAARDGRRVLYGIARGSSGTIIPLASIQGKLDAWMDFNRDGDWEDAGEQIIDSEDVQTGPDYTPLTFDVPANASPGFTFARFRFSLLGDLEFDGPAPNGEVEDYLLRILDPAVVTSPQDSGPGSLRDLIAALNLAGVPAIIDLRLLGKRDEVIALQSPLPPLMASVDIVGDGTVTIDGSAAGAGADGLRLQGDGSSITGVAITGFSGHGVVVDADDVLVQNGVITSNGGDGVRVLGARSVLLGNEITGNGGLAIDRGGDGPTNNDVPDADGVSNFPVVMTATATDSTRIGATLSAVEETGYIVEFFASPACGTGGKGGGASLGSVAVVTDAAGHADVSFTTDVLVSNFSSVSATATGAIGGTSEYASCFTATDTAGRATGLPTAFRLAGNYPNPFNPTTALQFDLPEPAIVTVTVFDMVGRKVLELAPRAMEAGTGRSIPVQATGLSSGLYVYRLEARAPQATYAASGRMTFIK